MRFRELYPCKLKPWFKMPNSVETANELELLDYPFLLITHMVCADQQIHSKEARGLHELISQAGIGRRSLEEMEKILAQDEGQISLGAVARGVPLGQTK